MKIDQAFRVLAKYSGRSDSAWMEDVLNHFSDKESVTDLITSLVDSSEFLEEAAKESFCHNLGFTRITLLGWKHSNFLLRLHIWDGSVEAKQGEVIHNHVNPFASKVITGALKFSLYQESQDGQLYSKYLNPLRFDEYHFNLQGEARLKNTMDVSLRPWSSYRIESDVLHCVTVSDCEVTSTISVHGAKDSDHTLMYVKDTLAQVVPLSERFSSGQLADLLLNYISVL